MCLSFSVEVFRHSVVSVQPAYMLPSQRHKQQQHVIMCIWHAYDLMALLFLHSEVIGKG